MIVSRRITRTDIYQTLQLLLGIGLGMVIYALLSELAGRLTIHHFHPALMQQLWVLFAKVWLPAVMIAPLIVICGLRFPFIPKHWRRAVGFHSTIFFTLTLIHALALSYEYHYFADMDPEMRTYKPWQHMGHFLFGDSVILFDLIIYTLLIANINLRHFYFIAQAKDVEANELSYQLTRTRLQALRMQINPHFLFNTLNAISVLVMKQHSQQAVEMIGRLSHLFRQSLEENQLLTSVEKELNTATQYLDIEQVRFGDRLVYDIECEKQLLSLQVPSMLLQPLLENSIRHGLSKNEAIGVLYISCKNIDNMLRLEIVDNGIGFDVALPVQGIGLDNVRQRLKNHYGNNHKFDIQSQANKGTRVIIEIPLTIAALSE